MELPVACLARRLAVWLLLFSTFLLSMDYLALAFDYDMNRFDYGIDRFDRDVDRFDSDASPKSDEDMFPDVKHFVHEFAHTDKDVERRLAYFREDITLNSHHYHFHSAFPFSQNGTREPITEIDRKGEQFYYVHQQVLARYDTERLANYLPRVVPFHNLTEPISEGYFPNFPPLTTEYQYPGRQINATLGDVASRPEAPHGATVDDLNKWKKRAKAAIIAQKVYDKDNDLTIYLNNSRGIDVLGAMLQSSTSSVDREYYGNLHNVGHLMTGRVHDPENKFGAFDGVMASAATTLRDPMFYRWHKGVSELMALHKKLLPPYTENELAFPNVKLTRISVYGTQTKRLNELTTYTQDWSAFLAKGFDFHSVMPIAVLFKLLHHEEFEYKLEVDNQSGQQVRAVVRIFMAPLQDETNSTFDLQEQRPLFMEMDKFKIGLRSGKQTILRHSLDSHVTLPTEKIFRILESIPDMVDVRLGHLGCGWPHHLLLPKGRVEGMQFTLFAMITDWEEDRADTTKEQEFEDATSYCGIYKQKYPDKRNLGFPLDRAVAENVTMETFLTPNMAVADVTIFHSQQIVPLGGAFNPLSVKTVPITDLDADEPDSFNEIVKRNSGY